MGTRKLEYKEGRGCLIWQLCPLHFVLVIYVCVGCDGTPIAYFDEGGYVKDLTKETLMKNDGDGSSNAKVTADQDI